MVDVVSYRRISRKSSLCLLPEMQSNRESTEDGIVGQFKERV